MDNTDSYTRRGTPPSHWYDTIDHKQTTNSFSAKGLRNAPGENNCFLNSAVQVFWHLDVFRRSFRRLTGHLCMNNSCIFCALKVIFTQLQFSDQSCLAPEGLRKALAESYINQQRYQLGHMDDACECFENILRRIHFHIANAYAEDSCQATHCLPHQKFAMTVFDQLVCSCGASSNPLTFNELVHYISTNNLISQVRSMHETGDYLHPDKFGLLLRTAGSSADIRDCPNSCGKRVQLRRTLLNCPDVVSIGLVWDSERPNTDLITEVCRSIGTCIMLHDVFHSVNIKGVKEASKLPKLQLSAVVCYYGKHYSTFVFSSKRNIWIYFDDTNVREIGPHWDHVVEKCCRGHYQPLLLLYTNPNANPITTETAPKKRVMAPGYATPTKVSSDKDSRKQADNMEGHQRSGDMKRSLTPNPPDMTRLNISQSNGGYRSITPNPADQLNSPDAEPSQEGKSEHRRQHSFLIAITGKNGKGSQSKSEYAVPANNMSIKQRLPGGQNSSSDYNSRNGCQNRPHNLPLSQHTTTQEMSSMDGYYTLSNNDQYRRPSISSPDNNNYPVTPNFSRAAEMQRKESFKKGKDKIAADVIRYQGNPRTSTSSSDSDSLGYGEGHSKDQAAPKLPPKHSRTRSISYEESPQNLSADNIDIRQHIIMKPKVCSGHTYENIENVNHSPLQSGLATLPRNKGKSSHQGQHSSYPKVEDQLDGGQHHPSISHSRESSTHTLTDDRHSRQSSINSQYTDNQQQSRHSNTTQKQSNKDKPHLSKKPQPGSKPPKPAKPEKKPGLSGHRKKGQTSSSQNSQTQGEIPSPTQDMSYINRKMVESVLNYQNQKLTRQGSNVSSVSQSSNTSFDSDTSSVKSHKDSLSSEIPYDTASLESHRDSGYGSSDRNSNSSQGSTTLDPFTQYFLNKSMIPPKTFNVQTKGGNLRNFVNADYSGSPSYNQSYNVSSQYYSEQNSGHLSSQDKTDKTLYTGHHVDNYHSSGVDGKTNSIHNGLDQYDSGQKHPSRPSDLSTTNRKQLYDPAIVKSHSQGMGAPVYQVKMQEGKSSLSIPPPVMSHLGDVTSSQQGHCDDEFNRLLHKSEELMDQCVLIETSENASNALSYCNAATDCLKKAMKITTISQTSFEMAQKMHNACLLKSRSLQKKFVTRQESTSSTTSSDSARSSPSISVSSSEGSSQNQNYHSYGSCCVQRTCNQSQRLQGTHSVESSIHSRSSSRDSVDSVIENKNYRKENRTSPLCEKSSQNSEFSSNSSVISSERTSASQCNFSNMQNIDIYATLPRRGRKSSSSSSNSSSQDPEVYKEYLNRQRSVNSVQHGRTPSTGSLTPTPMDMCSRESDFSNDDVDQSNYQLQNPTKEQVRSNRAEIRQLQHNNGGQFHFQGSGQYKSQSSDHSGTNSLDFPHHQYHQVLSPGLQQNEVCNSTPQHTARTHPVLPPKPAKPVIPTKQQQQQVKPEVLSTLTACSSDNSRWSATLPTASHKSSKMATRQSSLSRHASFTSSQQPLSDGAQRTYERCVSQPDCQQQQLGRSSPNYNLTDRSSNETPGYCDLQVPPSQLNITVPTAELLGQQSVEVTSTSRPLTPQNINGGGHSDGAMSEPEEFRPSVRDLASRFEHVDDSHASSRSGSRGGHASRSSSREPVGSGLVSRHRSKSESDFRKMQVKPKSVLTRHKKSRGNRPRKSVTFSDNIALVDSSNLFPPMMPSNDDRNSGYISDEEERYQITGVSYSDNDDDDSADSPIDIIAGEVACSLCGKKGVQYNQQYCDKCYLYMSQFQSQR